MFFGQGKNTDTEIIEVTHKLTSEFYCYYCTYMIVDQETFYQTLDSKGFSFI